MNIFVGNLPFQATESALMELFGEYGEVVSAKLIKDKETGQLKGFGFVEMSSKEEAMEAMEKLNGFEFMGRKLTVNEARERTDRDRGGFRGNDRGGDRGGRGFSPRGGGRNDRRGGGGGDRGRSGGGGGFRG